MNRLLFCLALLFTSAFVKAQTPIITLKVSDGKGEAVTAATIVVVPVSDSLNKQTKIADSTGTVIFNLSPNDLYLVRISSVNYSPLEKTVKIGNENTSFRFTLQPLSKSLGNVVIT